MRGELLTSVRGMPGGEDTELDIILMDSEVYLFNGVPVRDQQTQTLPKVNPSLLATRTVVCDTETNMYHTLITEPLLKISTIQLMNFHKYVENEFLWMFWEWINLQHRNFLNSLTWNEIAYLSVLMQFEVFCLHVLIKHLLRKGGGLAQ